MAKFGELWETTTPYSQQHPWHLPKFRRRPPPLHSPEFQNAPKERKMVSCEENGRPSTSGVQSLLFSAPWRFALKTTETLEGLLLKQLKHRRFALKTTETLEWLHQIVLSTFVFCTIVSPHDAFSAPWAHPQSSGEGAFCFWVALWLCPKEVTEFETEWAMWAVIYATQLHLHKAIAGASSTRRLCTLAQSLVCFCFVCRLRL